MKKISVFPFQETQTLTINFFKNLDLVSYSRSDVNKNDKLILPTGVPTISHWRLDSWWRHWCDK